MMYGRLAHVVVAKADPPGPRRSAPAINPQGIIRAAREYVEPIIGARDDLRFAFGKAAQTVPTTPVVSGSPILLPDRSVVAANE
jgi:hypothetical protein